MSSRSDLEKARELIRAKKYDEAREILLLSDHPQAAKWLDQLDGLDPGVALAEPDWSKHEQKPAISLKKYKALRVLRTIYELVAVLLIAGGVLFGVIIMLTPSFSFEYNSVTQEYEFIRGAPMVGQGLAILIGGLLSGVGILGFAQLIQLLIDLEENTRRTNELLLRRE